VRTIDKRLGRRIIAYTALLIFSAVGYTYAAGTEVGNFTAPLLATLGGTGQTSYTTGDLLYAGSGTTVSKLADVATGQVLASGGSSTAPAYTAGMEQSSSGDVHFSIGNKAGTVTCTAGATTGLAANLVTGTDSLAWSSSVASTVVSLIITSTSSLTVTTHTMDYTIEIDGGPATSAPQ
jgi:hypothetical protein